MPFQIRDKSGAARSVAYLKLAAAPALFVTCIVLPDTHPIEWVVATIVICAFLITGGVTCLRRPDKVPHAWWLIAPLFATALITTLNQLSGDASTGAQLFYLWPVLYSANFLSRRLMGVTLAAISAAHASVAFRVLPTGHAISDWFSLTVAFALTMVVVYSLRRRNDTLLEVLETQALADPLTEVANRRSFDGELTRAVAWSHRTDSPLALLTVDIDYFKKINDTWGHAVGDRALQQVAAALRVVARGPDDVVARLGGDEFVVLLRTDRMEARRAADDVRTALDEMDGLPGGPPGLSIGIALLPDHAETADELLVASDAALYEAKTGGRGRTAMAHPAPPRQNVDVLTQDQDRAAVRN
ncbi:GGDEF domain-containing protein [Actinoplanes sp. NPDC049596]|uniref:GGDEF domain-containing protein n=1 Tax=unclassified Actinoplanes TaxID=2626549 RepID=UPI00342DDA9F